MEHQKGKYVLTPESYREINETEYTLGQKIKAFFYHIYMVCFARDTPERGRYMTTFRQYENLANKEDAKKMAKRTD